MLLAVQAPYDRSLSNSLRTSASLRHSSAADHASRETEACKLRRRTSSAFVLLPSPLAEDRHVDLQLCSSRSGLPVSRLLWHEWLRMLTRRADLQLRLER